MYSKKITAETAKTGKYIDFVIPETEKASNKINSTTPCQGIDSLKAQNKETFQKKNEHITYREITI